MTVGQRIKFYRKARGLTQEELADRVEVRHPTVSKWEREEVTNIPIERLGQIAAVLDINVTLLLADDERKERSWYSDVGQAIAEAFMSLDSEHQLSILGVMRLMCPPTARTAVQFVEDVLEDNRRYDPAINQKLRGVWQGLKQRCNNPKCHAYKYYGARGIKVCEEWTNAFEAFRDWAIAHGYYSGLEIDRIDNDGNYEPSNCRWTTHKENMQNRRPSDRWNRKKGGDA